jgi:hypothetical protein
VGKPEGCDEGLLDGCEVGNSVGCAEGLQDG